MLGKRIPPLAGAVVMAVALVATAGTPASAATGFTTRGGQILDNGVPWVARGVTLSGFQDGIDMKKPALVVDAQLDAIAGAWHGNVVRFQIEQRMYVSGGDGMTAAAYRAAVDSAVAYAESLGLAVVINDQTEGLDGIATANQPLPTAETLAFWQDVKPVAVSPDVILDPFNEPRYLPGPPGPADGWAVWFNGGKGYIGEVAFVRDLRAMGYRNQIWAEAPGLSVLVELGVTWPRYVIPDPGRDLAYTFHHAAGLQNAVPTITEFNIQFGNLVTVRHVPVVDSEWTNRTVPYGSQGRVFSPSGDTGQCWGNAPVSVPVYLRYLAQRGIGMTIWTFGSFAAPGAAPYDSMNASGSPDPATANNYDGWAGGCVTPKGGTTHGAGQLVKNMFAAEAAGA